MQDWITDRHNHIAFVRQGVPRPGSPALGPKMFQVTHAQYNRPQAAIKYCSWPEITQIKEWPLRAPIPSTKAPNWDVNQHNL